MPEELDEQAEECLLMYVKGFYGYHPDTPAHIEESGKIYVGSDYTGIIRHEFLFLDRVSGRQALINLEFFKLALPEDANPN